MNHINTQGHYSVFENVGILGDKVLECGEFVTWLIHFMTTWVYPTELV